MAAESKTISAEAAPVMTVAEVCAYLHVHRSTLYRLIKAGEIPFFRMGSGLRFNRETIDEWRKSQSYLPRLPSHAAD